MKRKNLIVFLSLAAVALAVYFPTHDAGFVWDWFFWQNKFQHQSFADVFVTFGWHGNQQVMAFLIYTLYKIFGFNGWCWYLPESLLHATNAFLLYLFFIRFFKRYEIQSNGIALLGTFLFLLSPYNTESLVSRVCIQYLVCDLLLLASIHFILNYLEKRQKKFLWLIAATMLVAIFAIEFPLILPLATLVIVFFWQRKDWNGKIFWKDAGWIVLPQAAVIIVFFGANQLILGEWVGHYGVSTHFNFDAKLISSNFYKYVFKYTFFARYFHEPYKSEIFNLTSSNILIALFSIFLLIALIFYIVYFRKMSNRLKLAGMAFTLFLIFLLPVLNLWADVLLYVNNDRLAYPASMFFWMGIVLVLSAIPRWVRIPAFITAFACSIYFLLMTVNIWSDNGQVFNDLVNSFYWYDKDQVIILGVADNLGGTKMFGIYNQPSGFAQTLKYYRNKPFEGDMEEAAQFNMVNSTDGMTPRMDSSGELVVTFNQSGNWWWWDGQGATDRETSAMSIKVVDNTLRIHFKKLMPNHVIIYQNGSHWEEVPNL